MSKYKSSEETKKKICDSLKKKLQKKPLNQITVKEIVDDCEINRQTFYYHFVDIYDLAKWMFINDLQPIYLTDDKTSTWQEEMIYLFNYISNNKRIFISTICSIDREVFRKEFYRTTASALTNLTDNLFSSIELEKEEKDFIVNYLSISIASLLESYAYDEINLAPEKIVALTEKIINNLVDGIKVKNKSNIFEK